MSEMLSQVLALMGLRNRRTILKRNKQLLQDNLTLLGEFFHKFAGLFQWSEPDASSITFPQLASGDMQSDLSTVFPAWSSWFLALTDATS